MTNNRRRSDLRTSAWSGEGGGGLAVYDPRTDNGYLLNPSTAVVFEACDGRTSYDEMAARIAVRTGLPVDPAIVDLALAELESSGLLDNPVPRAAEPPGITRRTIMRRLALGAGAAAMLPMVNLVGGVSQLAADSPRKLAGTIPPLVAQDKSASTPPDTPVAITLSTTGGFVTPDSTAFLVNTDPTHGTVDLVGAVAMYTPEPGFLGSDTFTYIAWQCVSFADALACPAETGPFPDSGSEPATVTVTVSAPPDTSSSTTTAEDAAVAATTRPSFTG
jgi:hypothetical protein